MKKLKRIISPLAKKQLKELKDFNQIFVWNIKSQSNLLFNKRLSSSFN